MYEVFKYLSRKRDTMQGIGKRKCKGFLTRQRGDMNAFILRYAFEAVDTSMSIAANPDVNWHVKERRNNSIALLTNQVTLWQYNNYQIEIKTDEKGKLFLMMNLPVTGLPVYIYDSVKGEKSKTDMQYHFINYENIERTIQELYGDKLSKKYPEYQPVCQPENKSKKKKNDDECALKCYRLF